MTVETPENVSKTEPVMLSEEKTSNNTEQPKAESKPKVSPAQDLRNIQQLLVLGIFPGQAAPEICKAYQLLEAMAKKVEAQESL